MQEPDCIPANGTKLKITDLETSESFLNTLCVPEYRKAMRRKDDNPVLMAGYVAGHGGDIWWCQHSNGDVAPYGWTELELAEV